MGASVTVFSIPKPFRGHIGVIQRNAVASWRRLPGCEVILFGDDEGVAEAARDLGARHIPDIDRNEFGTPLVSAAFRLAEENAEASLLSYMNADIVVVDDFAPVAERLDLKSFLLVGRRWDLDVRESLDLDRSDFEQHLREWVRRAGRPHPPLGSDYFVYPRGVIADMPPFAVGRPGWDNWLIFRARSLQIPVIDITSQVTVVHQDHDYGHVPHGGDPRGWGGPEAERHLELVGGWNNVYTLYDVDLVLTTEGLTRPRGWRYSRNRIVRKAPALSAFARTLVRMGRRAIGRKGQGHPGWR